MPPKRCKALTMPVNDALYTMALGRIEQVLIHYRGWSISRMLANAYLLGLQDAAQVAVAREAKPTLVAADPRQTEPREAS